MRIYCWHYPSPEDVPKDYEHHTLQFVEDTSHGAKVNCGYCGEEFILRDKLNDCPSCGRNLIFGRFGW